MNKSPNTRAQLKRISIIIVTYNSSKYIKTLLKSITNDDKYIKEIIIIDNNSKDKKILKQIVKQYKNSKKRTTIQYLQRRTNKGFGSSCNLGAKKAKSKYIIFINPDTRILKNTITILFNHLRNNNADIIGGLTYNNKFIHNTAYRQPGIFIGICEFSNIGKIIPPLGRIAKNHFYMLNNNIHKHNTDKKVDGVSGNVMLIKKSTYNDLHGYDEEYHMYLEDVDLCTRAKMKKYKTYYCTHSISFHEGGGSSKNKHKINYKAWDNSRRYYYNKHYGKNIGTIMTLIFSADQYITRALSKQPF